ncbi:HPr family phosphocarrier protein [Parvularcula dongshanensis]|uniref:Phosphocarrier protein n=1 Tax=Parvularcula dongshanensis TaxID=1173995 RepID=A0A840I181_9PROT|nr:phosphocarrier protein [Parvularcula dongshanensis]
MTAEGRVTVCNRKGLHARAAAKFCTLAAGFDAATTVTKDQTTVGGASLMALLMLGAAKGSELTIRAEGPEADEAVAALTDLVEARFGEED